MHNLTNEFQYQRKANFLLKPAFYFFIFTCIAIPSGSFFGTPLRTVASTFLIFTFLADLIIGNQINLKHLSIGALFIVTLLSYSLLGMLNGYPAYSVRGQAMDVLATFLPAYLGSYLWLKEHRADTLITAFLFSGIAHALTKIIFFSLLFFGYFSLTEFLELHQRLFSLVPITTIIGNFYRINTVNDFILPLLLAYLFFDDKPGKLLKKIAFIIFATAIVISYSRYLWFFTIVIVFGSFALKTGIVKTSFLALGFFLVSVFTFTSMQSDPLEDFVIERYSGEKAEYSDSIRGEMLPHLIKMIEDSPLIGSGFGSYAPDYFRFDEKPWLYELQWISWTKDVGLLGLTLTIFAIFMYLGFQKLRWSSFFWKDYIFLISSSLWLATALFNCFLLGPVAGQIFLFLWLLRVNYCSHQARELSEEPGSYHGKLKQYSMDPHLEPHRLTAN